MDNYSALIKQNSNNYPYVIAYKTSDITISSAGVATIGSYDSVYPTDASGTIFNVGAGKFIAPVKGLYQFNVNFSVHNQSASSNDVMRFGLICYNGFSGYPTVSYAYDEMEKFSGASDNETTLLKSLSASFMMHKNATVALYNEDMEDTLVISQVCFNGYLVTAFN
jgi:hypothetical protein